MESGNLNLEVYIKNFTFLKRALRKLKYNIFKKKSKDSSYIEKLIPFYLHWETIVEEIINKKWLSYLFPFHSLVSESYL